MTSECDAPNPSGTFLWSNSLERVRMAQTKLVGPKEGCVPVYLPSRRDARLAPGIKAER
jgi:hypothetical protein